MDEYVDKIFSASKDLRSIADHIERIASAFYATGNDRMYEQLSFLADDIRKAEKEINNSVADMSRRNYTEAQDSVGRMLKALIGSHGK